MLVAIIAAMALISVTAAVVGVRLARRRGMLSGDVVTTVVVTFMITAMLPWMVESLGTAIAAKHVPFILAFAFIGNAMGVVFGLVMSVPAEDAERRQA